MESDEVGERQFPILFLKPAASKRAPCLCDAKTLNPPPRSPAPSGKTASLPLEFRGTRRQTCGGSYIADKGGIIDIGVSTEWTTGHKFRTGDLIRTTRGGNQQAMARFDFMKPESMLLGVMDTKKRGAETDTTKCDDLQRLAGYIWCLDRRTPASCVVG